MIDFDSKARDWDKEKMHLDRSLAVASELLKMIPLNSNMRALEYGAGTGLLSFLLKDRFSEITMMDSSREMVNATQEKIQAAAAKNMKSLFVDLEKEDFTCEFDIIYNQMALHHVCNIDSILGKFHFLLSKGGYLAIADLYKEDGSFHGEGFNGHNGFDIKTPHIIQLNKYPTTMIPAATIAKNTRRSLSVRTFLRMTASGNDSPMTAFKRTTVGIP